MADILFEELTPVLNYFPIKIGKAEILFHQERYFSISYDNLKWCVFNLEGRLKYSEIYQQFLEINLSRGRVVTTGLGFGLLQTILSKKDNISEIIAYEKHNDIIEVFKKLAEASNFDYSKIKLVNSDASKVIDEECDWLLLDHFELTYHTIWEIVDQVRDIANNCKANNVLFWPMILLFKMFCLKREIPMNQDSYFYFYETIKIPKLPRSLDWQMFPYFHKIYFTSDM